MAFLPEDLTTDILKRVESVKSIGRFRCVSKDWHSLLSTPQFLKSHFEKFHKHSPQRLLFLDSSPHVTTFTTDVSGSCSHTVSSNKVRFPDFNPNLHLLVQGSCHGLVLFGSDGCIKDANLVLLNPITEDGEKIPPIPNYDRYEKGIAGYGFGYDSCTDDYKIVSIQKEVLHIYSVKTKSWRTLQNSSRYRYHHRSGRRIFVNGRLYFLSEMGYHLVLAAFNLGTEEFESVPHPKGFYEQRLRNCNLLDLGGLKVCLTIYDYDAEHVWLMKDCGGQDCWMKFTINSRVFGYPTSGPLCFLGCEDEIVVSKWGETKFFAYNLRSGSVSKEIVVTGTSDMPFLGMAGMVIGFRESLVSPNYGALTDVAE